jgi:methylphosphotriester-DNA--protein-cysteine methyltransferase
MSTPKKRRVISVAEKKAVIEAAQKDNNKTKLAKQFTMPESTVRRILKEKEVVLGAIEEGSQAKRVHLKAGKHQQMEEALIVWHKQMRSNNVPVSGDLMKVSTFIVSLIFINPFQEKALLIAADLGILDFKASTGWLDNFKHRYGIQFRTEQGEAGAVDVRSLREWQQQVLGDSLAGYSADDIFNADETGLFWQLLPNKTMAMKG